ncbi:SMP-30/gluconolactonase/LRE family protein [Bosea sp. (in: a-proteobacteria)]|uniref:SMP-30/gluconolactonase/LRE family protein n=1 Tax=Bosea sp. (in: a-proteobacteria) TaxID=1871050 RepID=UPI0026271B08|nr:SMP-30/gluconolactonase/LRE family protein [Bosea sp. (in: a-proteobacteria)]MCO5090230.1 SMP-30/gluconolactonase/LRE family protein [Bosea sp. (in: a-proteobacteria)]
MHNPISTFKVAAADLSWTGSDLGRPECILAEPDGTLWVADNRAIVTKIAPDGSQSRLGEMPPMPNGMALEREGSLLVANLETGEFLRMLPDGGKQLLLDAFEGRPLGSLNFVYIDDSGAIWLTISTRTVPRRKALDEPVDDGFILRLDALGKPELMARGFYFTNEIRIDRNRSHLYVAETTAGRVSRAPFNADGSLGRFETFGPAPLYDGARVDGITFDAAGNLWVTELSRNAIVAITPAGESHTIFEDPAGEQVRAPTSVTFGGADLKTVYVGSLVLDRLATFRSPIAGEPMYHWRR